MTSYAHVERIREVTDVMDTLGVTVAELTAFGIVMAHDEVATENGLAFDGATALLKLIDCGATDQESLPSTSENVAMADEEYLTERLEGLGYPFPTPENAYEEGQWQ